MRFSFVNWNECVLSFTASHYISHCIFLLIYLWGNNLTLNWIRQEVFKEDVGGLFKMFLS
jgi:hypothetical protein